MSELSDDVREEIISDLKSGRKIAAIKRYREATGAGLKDAKEFIETLTDRMSAEFPDQVSKPSGCLGVLLLSGIAAATYVMSWVA